MGRTFTEDEVEGEVEELFGDRCVLRGGPCECERCREGAKRVGTYGDHGKYRAHAVRTRVPLASSLL